MSNPKNPFIRLKESIKKMATNPSFTLKEQFGFSAGCFGSNMGQDMVGTFIVLFLTRYVGIEMAVVTVLMLVAQIITIVMEPISGTILDRGLGKNSRSLTRPFLLITPFPLAITSILLYVIPAQSMNIRILWVVCFYLTYVVSGSLYGLSLNTMSVRMCGNPKDRKNFYSLAELASCLGTTLPGGVIPIFISMYKNDFSAQQNIYLIGALIFGVLGMASMIMPYFTLKERNPAISIKKPKVSLNAKALIHNRPLLVVTASEIADSIRKICYGALAFFYLETLNAFWLSTVVGAVSVGLTYVGILLVPVIGNKITSRNMVVFSYLYSGLCYGILLLSGYKYIWLVGILIAISGFPNGLMRSAKRILLADSTEYMEWKTWKKYGTPVRSDGMVFALHSMALRINSLWTSVLLPAGLGLIGYVSASVVDGVTVQAVQTPETLKGIFYLVAVPGTLGNIIPGLIMLFDNYTGKRKEDILEELKQLRAERDVKLAFPDPVDEEVLKTEE
jgi:GPH family glycoside/pentoside/hexuronide:cation symporter